MQSLIADLRRSQDRRATPPLWPFVAAALAVAAASLAIPAAMGYDPWSWLVWGREVAALDLRTRGGPSWKPLPVVVTTLLSPFGGVAPALWLLVARAAGLLALVLAHRLASRVAGPVAGWTAVALLVLTPDPEPRFVRLLLEGHTGLMGATLVLWAIERHLDRRHGHALLLATCVALLRPEAWPFLGLYAAWLWAHRPDLRPAVGVGLAVVPVLWFGGDWWGAGDPWRGGDLAQVEFDESTNRTGLALRRFVESVPVAAWVAAGWAVGAAVRTRDRLVLVLAGGALGWMSLVVAMTVVLRYASLSRFFLPGAAVLCVVAGVGVGRAVSALASRRHGRASVVALVTVGTLLLAPRTLGVPEVVAEVQERARQEADMRVAVQQAGGSAVVTACGHVSLQGSGVERPALAWTLEVPLRSVRSEWPDGAGVVVATRRAAERDLPDRDAAVVLATTAHWVVYAVGCEIPRAPAGL